MIISIISLMISLGGIIYFRSESLKSHLARFYLSNEDYPLYEDFLHRFYILCNHPKFIFAKLNLRLDIIEKDIDHHFDEDELDIIMNNKYE